MWETKEQTAEHDRKPGWTRPRQRALFLRKESQIAQRTHTAPTMGGSHFPWAISHWHMRATQPGSIILPKRAVVQGQSGAAKHAKNAKLPATTNTDPRETGSFFSLRGRRTRQDVIAHHLCHLRRTIRRIGRQGGRTSDSAPNMPKIVLANPSISSYCICSQRRVS